MQINQEIVNQWNEMLNKMQPECIKTVWKTISNYSPLDQSIAYAFSTYFFKYPHVLEEIVAEIESEEVGA
jgi:hypothetical protein